MEQSPGPHQYKKSMKFAVGWQIATIFYFLRQAHTSFPGTNVSVDNNRNRHFLIFFILASRWVVNVVSAFFVSVSTTQHKLSCHLRFWFVYFLIIKLFVILKYDSRTFLAEFRGGCLRWLPHYFKLQRRIVSLYDFLSSSVNMWPTYSLCMLTEPNYCIRK